MPVRHPFRKEQKPSDANKVIQDQSYSNQSLISVIKAFQITDCHEQCDNISGREH